MRDPCEHRWGEWLYGGHGFEGGLWRRCSLCGEWQRKDAPGSSNRRAAEDALRRLEVQEQVEESLAKLEPELAKSGEYCEECGRVIEWDGHTEASHLRAELVTMNEVARQHEAAAARLELELALERRIAHYAMTALIVIARQDYRGSEPFERRLAENALKEIDKLRKKDEPTEGTE